MPTSPSSSIPADYEPVIEALRAEGQVPFALRQRLAAKAYARTAAYDATISNWFADALDYPDLPWRSFTGTLSEVMRYGENPHQWAAFYKDGTGRTGVASADQVQGKTLSLQQYQRHRRRLRAGVRIRFGRRRRRRHHQARQSLRRRHRRNGA